MFWITLFLIWHTLQSYESIIYNIIGEAGILLSKGKNLTQIPVLAKEYVVLFEYKLNQTVNNSYVDWYNIIYFANDFGNNTYDNENGILSLSFRSDGSLEIGAVLNGNFYSIYSTRLYGLNQWFRVEICQIFINENYSYRVKINNTNIFSKINNQAQTFNDVMIYASNPWNLTQNGLIKNLLVVNGISNSSLDQWSAWSQCNTSYGYGFRNRTRKFYASENTTWSLTEVLSDLIECYIYKNECQMVKYIIEDNTTQLIKAKNITKLPILDKQFIVSFDFIPYSFNSNLSNIIHFINDSDNIANNYHGVWLDNLGVLQVSALINGTNFLFQAKSQLQLNQWSKIEISQIFINESYFYRVEVDKKEIVSVINTQVQSLKNIILYASNPRDTSQNGSIKNLFIANNQSVWSGLLQWSNWSSCNASNKYGWKNRTRYLGRECYTVIDGCYEYKDMCQSINYVIKDIQTSLRKANNLTKISTLEKEFIVSFEFIPNSFNSNLSNIIHFISDSNTFANSYPRVWLDNKGFLKVSALINGTEYTFSNNTLQINRWSKIDISQVFINGSFLYRVKVDDKKFGSVINKNISILKNVTLYASNPWNISQNGSIKNLFVANKAVLSGYLQHWSNWSSCNTSNGYGFINRTRYLDDECYIELKECYIYKDVCQMVNYVIEDITTPLQQNINIIKMPILDTEFIVSFDFIPYSFNDGLSNIINFVNDSDNIANDYNGVWLDNVNGLQVSALINDTNFLFPIKTLELNQWSKIEISQMFINKSYLYTVKVDNVEFKSVINTNVQSFKNVILYASNPWNISQNGSIKNLFVANNRSVFSGSLLQWSNWLSCNTSNGYGFINRTRYLAGKCYTELIECYVYKDECQMVNYIIEDNTTPLLKAKNVTKLPILDKQFIISFDFIAYSFNSNLSNIIHFINDSDNIANNYHGVWLDNLGGLQVSALINGSSFMFQISSLIQLNQWSKIEISQKFTSGNYLYRIRVDNNEIMSVINTNVQRFKNVILYASNPWSISQNGSIKNLIVANNQSVVLDYLFQWSNWSRCNTSNGYGITNRTRYLGEECYTEIEVCYVYKEPMWNVSNTVSIEGNFTLLNLQIYPTFIKPSVVSLEFEYFLPRFFTFASNSTIQRFVRTQVNRLKYTFNGNFTYSDSFNYNFTAFYNNSICPVPGVFTLEILLMVSLHVLTEKRERKARTFQKQVECFNNPKIPVDPNQQFLKESYGRGIYWDNYNQHIYVCMSQHYPSTKPGCYFSDDGGYLWTAMDIRIGSVLGLHSIKKELYAIHRNRKTYLKFDKEHRKWLAITNQQFLDKVNELDLTFVKNLEGDFDQVYALGPYQWLGNAEGLFCRKLESDLWIKRVKWIL